MDVNNDGVLSTPAVVWASEVEGNAFSSLRDVSAACTSKVSLDSRSKKGRKQTFRRSAFFRFDS